MKTFPAPPLGSVLCALLPALLLALVLVATPGCSDPEMEQALQQAEQELAQCRKEKQQLQDEVAELRKAARQQPSQKKTAQQAQTTPDDATQQRLRQLEYTLNRAYIDMKTALVEREQCEKRYKQMRRQRDDLQRRLDQTAGAN